MMVSCLAMNYHNTSISIYSIFLQINVNSFNIYKHHDLKKNFNQLNGRRLNI